MKYRILFTLLILLQPISLLAQWYNPDKVGKKARMIYEQAYDRAVNGQYEASMQLLNDALKEEPRFVEVYLSRAGIQADMKNYQGSVQDFSYAFTLDSVFSSTYLLPYSISLAGIGRFEEAHRRVTAFLETPGLNTQSKKAGNYRKRVYEFAMEMEKKYPAASYPFNPLNMGDSINSSYLEYFPSLTIDGNKLIFTRRVNQDEDFYESYRSGNTWMKAKPLAGKINTNLNEGAQSIAQDGEWLVFTGCNYPEGLGSCDLYIAYQMKNGQWTEPENLGSAINSEAWESSPSLSPDKQSLYFSSNRSGGLGGKDIWVSHRTAQGRWGTPENLGSAINTPGDEGSPFIHADNSTLYFNSNGHDGYGMTDLFQSKRQTDQSWGTPQNLGYPVNTIDDEGSLVVGPDGATAYYASDRGHGAGGLDLFSFSLRPEMRATPTSWVRGIVYDSLSKAGLPSRIELTDTLTRNLHGRLQTNEEGRFLITLPEGRAFSFNVNRKGYLFYSDYFYIPPGTPEQAITLNIPLQPIQKGAAIVLKNIFFESRQSGLSPASQVELDRLLQLLRDNPSLQVEISGHTDGTGKKEENLILSQKRAQAVVQYLTGKGIEAKRLIAKGYGDSRPVANNLSAEGKSLNRRTELHVMAF